MENGKRLKRWRSWPELTMSIRAQPNKILEAYLQSKVWLLKNIHDQLPPFGHSDWAGRLLLDINALALP